MATGRRVLALLVGRDDGVIQSYFGIEHEGKLWLVTAWLVDRAAGTAVPERMIRVDSAQSSQPPWDYANILLPTAVIEGVGQSPGFEVRSLPSKPTVAVSELYQLPPFP